MTSLPHHTSTDKLSSLSLVPQRSTGRDTTSILSKTQANRQIARGLVRPKLAIPSSTSPALSQPKASSAMSGPFFDAQPATLALVTFALFVHADQFRLIEKVDKRRERQQRVLREAFADLAIELLNPNAGSTRAAQREAETVAGAARHWVRLAEYLRAWRPPTLVCRPRCSSTAVSQRAAPAVLTRGNIIQLTPCHRLPARTSCAAPLRGASAPSSTPPKSNLAAAARCMVDKAEI